MSASLLLCGTFQTLIALRGQFTFHSLSQQVSKMGGSGREWSFKEKGRGERVHGAKGEGVVA